MIREADVRSLVSDTLYEAEAEAERLAPLLGPQGEDHWMAILAMQEAIEFPCGINWSDLDEALAVPYLFDRGECLWLGPRTCSFLNTVSMEWATSTASLIDLVELITGDQRHLAHHLVHLAEAAADFGVPEGKVRRLATDGLLSHVEIEGIEFILRDDAYHLARHDLGAWIKEWNQ